MYAFSYWPQRTRLVAERSFVSRRRKAPPASQIMRNPHTLAPDLRCHQICCYLYVEERSVRYDTVSVKRLLFWLTLARDCRLSAAIVADTVLPLFATRRTFLTMAKRVELLIAGIVGLLAGGLIFGLGVRRGLKEAELASLAASHKADPMAEVIMPRKTRYPTSNATTTMLRPLRPRLNRTRLSPAAMRLARANSTIQRLRRKIDQERFEVGEWTGRSTNLRGNTRRAPPLRRSPQHPVRTKLPIGQNKLPKSAAPGDKTINNRVSAAQALKPKDRSKTSTVAASKAAKPVLESSAPKPSP